MRRPRWLRFFATEVYALIQGARLARGLKQFSLAFVMNKTTLRKALNFIGLGPRLHGSTHGQPTASPDGSPRRLEPTTIQTKAGQLKLRPASLNEIKALGLRWPMGLVIADDGAANGLNFQVGEEEALAVKLQPADTDELSATALYFNNLTLIAAALPEFVKRRHLGVTVPCAYLKAKGNERFESGIALFVSPDRASIGPELQPAERVFDELLGDGASKMIVDFIDSTRKASETLGVPMATLIGVDVRPRLALGNLGMPLVAVGEQLLAIQFPLREEHTFWEHVVRAGYAELPYAAMRTSAVDGPPNAPHSWLERVKILAGRLEFARAAAPH